VFPVWVIEAVDILEDGDFSGAAYLPRVPPDQFGLDGLEKGDCATCDLLTQGNRFQF